MEDGVQEGGASEVSSCLSVPPAAGVERPLVVARFVFSVGETVREETWTTRPGLSEHFIKTRVLLHVLEQLSAHAIDPVHLSRDHIK